MKATAMCPYCGHENGFTIDPIPIGPRQTIVHCDSEDGGCDRPYFVRFRVVAQTKVYKIDRDETTEFPKEGKS